MNTKNLVTATDEIGKAAADVLKVAHILKNTSPSLALRLADNVEQLMTYNTIILKQLEKELA